MAWRAGTSSAARLLSCHNTRDLIRTLATGPPLHHSENLVEDLKFRFRLKQMETQGLSDLNKISVEDVRSIWISSLLAESGLPLHKVFLSEEIFLEMEQELLSHLTVDQNGYVEYDDYLDTMLRLVRPIVTTQDELDLAEELFELYFPDSGLSCRASPRSPEAEERVKQLREKPISTVKLIRLMKKLTK